MQQNLLRCAYAWDPPCLLLSSALPTLTIRLAYFYHPPPLLLSSASSTPPPLLLPSALPTPAWDPVWDPRSREHAHTDYQLWLTTELFARAQLKVQFDAEQKERALKEAKVPLCRFTVVLPSRCTAVPAGHRAAVPLHCRAAALLCRFIAVPLHCRAVMPLGRRAAALPCRCIAVPLRCGPAVPLGRRAAALLFYHGVGLSCRCVAMSWCRCVTVPLCRKASLCFFCLPGREERKFKRCGRRGQGRWWSAKHSKR